jgi:DNA-binding response OmpR family regulator
MSQKLLLIDDSEEMQKLVQMFLERDGYAVIPVSDGRDGLRQLTKIKPDLVLLDIMMPDVDGWEICRRIREISDIPIIMLTAKNQERDIVRGLEMGADDYVTKPFDPSELRARIQSLLRRTREMVKEERSPQVLDDGWLYIDLGRRTIKADNKAIDLTPTEFRLLAALLQKVDCVVSHQHLLRQVWGPEYSDEVHYLKLYIRYLRKKLEQDPSNPRYLLTEWGVGYRFRDIGHTGSSHPPSTEQDNQPHPVL